MHRKATNYCVDHFTCDEEKDHEHEPREGTWKGLSLTKHSEQYLPAIAKALVRAMSAIPCESDALLLALCEHENETFSACACAHVAEEQPHYSSVLNKIVKQVLFMCLFQRDKQNTQNNIHLSRVQE